MIRYCSLFSWFTSGAGLPRCISIVIIIILAVPCSPGQTAKDDNASPVALDYLNNVGLVILDATDTISVNTIGIHGTTNWVGRHYAMLVAAGETPVDLTLAEQGTERYVFVLTKPKGISTCVTAKGRRCGSIIHQMDVVDRSEVRQFGLDGVGTGLDYDEHSGMLYFVTADDHRLFRISILAPNPRIELVGTIAGIGQVGPLGVMPGDPGMIFVGDVLSGGICLFDLNSLLTRKLPTDLGNVTAITIYRAKRLLYVGDSSRRRISIFKIGKLGELSTVASSKGEGAIGTPHSVTLIGAGAAVADTELLSLSIFDADWKLTSPLRVVSQQEMAAKKVSGDPPSYPPIAKASYVQGTVVLQGVISREGIVEDVWAVAGPRMLQQAAVDAVKKWRYSPYVINKVPAEVKTTMTINFSIN